MRMLPGRLNPRLSRSDEVAATGSGEGPELADPQAAVAAAAKTTSTRARFMGRSFLLRFSVITVVTAMPFGPFRRGNVLCRVDDALDVEPHSPGHRHSSRQ